jgi:hypothetical protein
MLTDHSHLAIPALLHAIVVFIPASGHTSALMPIAKRRSLVEPLSLAIKIIIPALWKKLQRLLLLLWLLVHLL